MPDFSEEPIAIAGAGKIAQSLGRLLAEGGVRLVAVAGRTPESSLRAAEFIGGARAASLAELPGLAPNVIVAVTDAAIPEVAAMLAAAGLNRGIVLHTCGALGPEALAPLTEPGISRGVLHPLQTVMSPEQGVRDIPGAAFGIAGDDAAAALANRLARVAGGRPVRIAPDRMAAWHAAAVFAGNYAAALVDAATGAMELAGISEDDARAALGPLARTSLENALRCGPGKALTGPVARGDTATVSAHLRALEGCTSIDRLYRAAGLQLVDLVRRCRKSPEPIIMEEMQQLLCGKRGLS